ELAKRDIEIDVTELEEGGSEAPQKQEAKAPGPAKPAAKPATGAAKQTGGAKDNLTAEERRMLERMGGGGNIADLNRPKAGGGSAASGPSLTASQLSSVVQGNKAALQRCY